MSRIIIPDAVRVAVAERPELADTIDALRIRAAAQLLVDQDAPTRFAIGNSSAYGSGPPRRFSSTPGGPGACAPPPAIPGCFGPDNRRLCDMSKVSVGVIIGGGQTFNLQIEPTNSAWFQPLACRMTCVDAENVTLNSRVLITAVTLNDAPVEATNVTNPVAPALANNTRFNGWWSDDYQDPDAYAVGVPWPIFSDLTNKLPLRIIGIAQGIPAASFVALTVTIYGNPAAPQVPTH